jgi:hypothetical protein
MLAFALGTLPALLSLSALSSFTTGALQRHFLKFASAMVIVLGLFNIQYGFVLIETGTGAQAPATPAVQRTAPTPAVAKQVVEMRVEGLDYFPNRFVVKQGIPVEWRIDASRAAGCGRILIAPALGIRTFLSASGTTVLTFTPDQIGEFAFNCGMGMMTPDSKFTVVPNA